jgi:MoxR-like ATPase
MKASRVRALMEGRQYITHDDVQSIALPVLGHRLIMQPESEMDGQTIATVVQQLIERVPVIVDAKA